jgi:hypothetical protein
MLQPIKEFTEEACQQRSIDAHNDIAVNNPEFKELSTQISAMETQFKDLHGFDEYKDAVLKRESLLALLLYQQGFKDGFEIASFVISNYF